MTMRIKASYLILAVSTAVFGGCDDGTAAPLAAEVEHIELVDVSDIAVDDKADEADGIGACLGPDLRLYEPGSDELTIEDAFAELPEEVQEGLPEDWWDLDVSTEPPSPSATCTGAGVWLYCSTSYYGCATCFQNGQPRRQATRYKKYCWCQNGQLQCGSCVYDYSYCVNC